ncbi:hypothetical protein PCS91_21065 [Escherichia coli]|uniref:hypothetical protein n=1 Tax=Escherichia coli TaxID=562 RepID=UPI0028155AE1|nr:hypothetical protein [Escherichia coli]WMO85079.1 hypothetical protein PCS91_21065 [Escherichia coli]HEI2760481.1 hypothetical protein [Escherichia coli]
MSINKLDIEKHINKRTDTIVNLHKMAISSGFQLDGHDNNCLERAAYALRKAGVKDISEADEFASKNEDLLRDFFHKLRAQSGKGWLVTLPFLYELVAIIREPSIFNEEYKKICNWEPDGAEMMDAALKGVERHRA